MFERLEFEKTRDALERFKFEYIKDRQLRLALEELRESQLNYLCAEEYEVLNLEKPLEDPICKDLLIKTLDAILQVYIYCQPHWRETLREFDELRLRARMVKEPSPFNQRLIRKQFEAARLVIEA